MGPVLNGVLVGGMARATTVGICGEAEDKQQPERG
jgi:hypothetical protein